METSTILWDSGTAYDLFISLEVLHEPSNFGVRGAWAAGVRARIPSDEREMLEQGRMLVHIPFHWLYSLPAPKDGTTALWALAQIPPAERLPTLAFHPHHDSDEVAEMLKEVAERGNWDEQDVETLRAAYTCKEGKKSPPATKKLEMILNWWSRPAEFGERYLEALRIYHEVFFIEEEKRIEPVLKAALEQAQEMAKRMSLADLVEELSQGVRFDELPEPTRVVLAPSYWSTPLIFYGDACPDLKIFAFGARPADVSLVPGEDVPDALLRVLKALSDATRLRIMYYLTNESLTPAELARRLRLRAPTVTHHLKKLRLAGLVQVTVGEGKETKHYAARTGAVSAACDLLKTFLEKGEDR
jgi:DNA-binding transcriptional ArsR family regulator